MNEEDFSPEEIARRRDEVIRRMANTPPQHRASRPLKKKKSIAGRLAKKRGDRRGKS